LPPLPPLPPLPDLPGQLLATSAEGPTSDGLIAAWSFDERSGRKVRDHSGHGNHARIAGATRVKGRHGRGLRFDSARQRVSLRRLSGDTRIVTVTAWVRPDSRRGARFVVVNGDRIAIPPSKAGKWVHVAATWSGGMAGSRLSLGGFKGRLDEVRVYDRAP
jgi:hypothetical protein